MAKFDTFEYAGIEQSLADRGFSLNGSSAQFVNQNADTLRMAIPGGEIGDAESFPFEAIIIFRTQRDSATGAAGSFTGGSVEFIGRRIGEVIDMRPNYEGVAYEFHGPWYELEHTVYQQPVASFTTGARTFPFSSDLLLYSRVNTTTGVITLITNGDQIRDVLQFVIDGYADPADAPFQIGDIDPAREMPELPCKPMMCSAAIEKCLELAPDCVVAFDYNPDSGPPVIHVKSVYNLTPVTKPLAGSDEERKQVRIVPRPDLKPRCVIVLFKITSTIDGANFLNVVKQKYGPGGDNSGADPERGLRVIVDWIDLVGTSKTNLSQHLETAAVASALAGTQAEQRAFWAAHDKQFADLHLRLQDSAGAATTFGTPIIEDADTTATVSLFDYPRELVDGSIAPWMNFNVKRVKISVPVTYAVYDAVGSSETDTATGNRTATHVQKLHHVEITVTNGTTGDYFTEGSFTTGEEIPANMARDIWTALNRLQYEGSHLSVKNAIDGGISMFNTLNLSGGRAEWAAMNAQIQSIKKHYGSGETEVNIGPAKHLNADQLMSIFRAFRYRLMFINPALRGTGAVGSSGSGGTEISKNAPKKNTMEGLPNPSMLGIVYKDNDNPASDVKGKASLAGKDIAGILAATTPTPIAGATADTIKEVKFRELLVCDASNNQYYIIVPATAGYTKSA